MVFKDLTDEEVALIGEALREMPFKKVAPLINKLQSQLNEQLVPATSPPEV